MSRRRGWDGPNWCAYWWFVGWTCFSLGLHVCVDGPHAEVHLPFGFFRIGRKRLRARELNAEFGKVWGGEEWAS